MRGAWIFLALVALGGVACLATIDESRLDAKDPTVGDDDDDRDAGVPITAKDGTAPEPDASVTPTKTDDGGLSCPQPTTLCGDKCCHPPSCKGVLAATPGAPTGPTTISFQSTDLSVFCDQTTRGGGWTMLHRLSAGVAGDPFIAYTSIPLNDTLAAEVTTKASTVHYTSRILSQWNKAFPVAEVMLQVLDTAGKPLREIVFDGAGSTPTTFMAPAKIKASSWTDLTPATPFVDFSVEGSGGLQRRFFIHKPYEIPPGCPADVGWLVVHGTPADVPCKTEYEAPFDKIRVMFASGTTAQKWTEARGEAAAFAVFVR